MLIFFFAICLREIILTHKRQEEVLSEERHIPQLTHCRGSHMIIKKHQALHCSSRPGTIWLCAYYCCSPAFSTSGIIYHCHTVFLSAQDSPWTKEMKILKSEIKPQDSYSTLTTQILKLCPTWSKMNAKSLI